VTVIWPHGWTGPGGWQDTLLLAILAGFFGYKALMLVRRTRAWTGLGKALTYTAAMTGVLFAVATVGRFFPFVRGTDPDAPEWYWFGQVVRLLTILSVAYAIRHIAALPKEDSVRHAVRDSARDEARDPIRDLTRDAIRDVAHDLETDGIRHDTRDAARDDVRDPIRDLAHDKAANGGD
jgi:hypothetical protein